MIQSGLAGLIYGCAAALIGLCLVLTYRMAGVINFSQASLGTYGAFIMLHFYNHGWALVPAILAGLVVGGGLAVIVGLAMLKFFPDASVDVKTAVTIGILVSFLALGARSFGTTPQVFPQILSSAAVTISGVVIPGPTVLGIVLALALSFALTVFLRYTKTGTQLRAVSSRPVTAELLGIPVRALTIAIWALGGIITTMAAIIIAPFQGGSYADMSLLIIPGLAAALFGVFRSLPLTVIGGLGIGVVGGFVSSSATLSPYQQSVAFFVILIILLYRQRREVWDAAR